jgi:hypothetical protein
MLCQIVERGFDTETNEWSIRLESCAESRHITLRNPFSSSETAEVDWFFQEYCKFPVAETVRAGKVINAVN